MVFVEVVPAAAVELIEPVELAVDSVEEEVDAPDDVVDAPGLVLVTDELTAVLEDVVDAPGLVVLAAAVDEEVEVGAPLLLDVLEVAGEEVVEDVGAAELVVEAAVVVVCDEVDVDVVADVVADVVVEVEELVWALKQHNEIEKNNRYIRNRCFLYIIMIENRITNSPISSDKRLNTKPVVLSTSRVVMKNMAKYIFVSIFRKNKVLSLIF